MWSVLLALGAPLCWAQDASLRGGVSIPDGEGLPGAIVTATAEGGGPPQTAITDARGEYYFGSLPIGLYILKVEAQGYPPVEKRGVRLAVGAKHEELFTLTALSASKEDTALTGLLQALPQPASLQVETVASSVSVVVQESQILQLPLESRNIYALFLLQPGVTSQGGIVRRGLSFSVHGQRVSGSNYRLDGVDNNNIVLTGPLAATSTEATQEFRMVNSSFSSEHGRATAFVAQVATRSGSNSFRGTLFEYLANTKLNANTFENNSHGIGKTPLQRNQFGYFLGGPIRRSQTFFSSTLEFSRLRHGITKELRLPSSSFIAQLPEDSVARRLLTETPPVATAPSEADPNIGSVQYQVPNYIDSWFATKRLDHHLGAKGRLVFRYTLASSQQRSDQDFTGYPGIWPTDRFRTHNTLLGWTHTFDAGRINDLRLGWSRERIALPQPRPGLPILNSIDGVALPGSPRELDVRENNNVLQVSDVFSLRRGRSALTLGFESRASFSNGVSLGLQTEALGGEVRLPNGFYLFPSLSAFGAGQADYFAVGVDRLSPGPPRLVDLRRDYRSIDLAGFVQEDLKLSPRFSLNLGLRYEYFGILHNTDRSRDLNFYFGPGQSIEEKLATGSLRPTDQNPGDLKGRLYRRDLFNLAPSFGLAWDPFGRSQTVLRAGYAVALDRVFDTLRDLRTNELKVLACIAPFCPTFQIPFESNLPLLEPVFEFREVIQLDENLRTPYAQNWYVGLQQTLAPNLLLEVGHAGSVGKKLISRDVVNRYVNDVAPPNAEIGENTFLSNAGDSNYAALEVSLRQRSSRNLQYQFSYTYSHAIDNQSDILEGVRTGPGPGEVALATFTRPLDSRLDRGNANFDQRHNLVFNAIWDIPAPRFRKRWPNWLLAGWTSSVIAAYRSGFPVTVISSLRDSQTGLRNNRVDFLGANDDSGRPASPQPVDGGVQWLDPDLFAIASGRVGNSGRGAIKGPGFWNYDFAALKNFVAGGDRFRLQFRAEFYNILNHANLSAPVSFFTRDDFGKAYYGLNRTFSRFGDLPLENPSRRVQFALRLQF